jgi:hypothetical protein
MFIYLILSSFQVPGGDFLDSVLNVDLVGVFSGFLKENQ